MIDVEQNAFEAGFCGNRGLRDQPMPNVAAAQSFNPDTGNPCIHNRQRVGISVGQRQVKPTSHPLNDDVIDRNRVQSGHVG